MEEVSVPLSSRRRPSSESSTGRRRLRPSRGPLSKSGLGCAPLVAPSVLATFAPVNCEASTAGSEGGDSRRFLA